jgi:hypothetical protein
VRAREHGSRPGCQWKAEADGPDNEVERTYRGIVAFYPTQLGQRSTRESVEVLKEPTSRREARRRRGEAERILAGLPP